MTKVVRKLRCAVYTRKSSDEGLEQEFNSLDAQREACEAYIASQKPEGWVLVRDAYDDGGFSGGTLERPALKRLLADIEAGRVDVVVVYKIDRLTRSLADFAKLVEVFDRHEVTFVYRHPVVQHHHLHGPADAQHPALLRPVRARGHGRAHPRQDRRLPPEGHVDGRHRALGYEVRDRKLVVNEAEAAIVRMIFERFVETGRRRSWRGSCGRRACARKRGRAGRQGLLYRLLNNRVYLGEAVHKGNAYPGEHAAIVDRALWDRVHAILQRGPRTRASNTRAQTPALLKGLIFGAGGAAMSPTHTRKRGRLYRYYVARRC